MLPLVQEGLLYVFKVSEKLLTFLVLRTREEGTDKRNTAKVTL
jgi:hypothetical protein